MTIFNTGRRRDLSVDILKLRCCVATLSSSGHHTFCCDNGYPFQRSLSNVFPLSTGSAGLILYLSIRLAPDWRHSETGSRPVRIRVLYEICGVARWSRSCGQHWHWRWLSRARWMTTTGSQQPYSWPYSSGTRLTRCHTFSVPSSRSTIPRTGCAFGESRITFFFVLPFPFKYKRRVPFFFRPQPNRSDISAISALAVGNV